jgi:uncharacterized Rossmann fold enzyme
MAHGLKRLDVETTKVKTTFCISDEQRDHQMRLAIPRVKARVVPAETVSDEEIAIVCYGPSLRKTWHEIKNFKKIMTCSGAHKYLLDRGIVPTWHVDLDPREHKARMLGTPHKDVEYLIASCVHPTMLDKLEGFNVKLWHIFANEDNRELPLVYPRGEWILTGGSNVGLRCLVMARILGYRKFHVFGMDNSFPADTSHHADIHLNASAKVYEVPYHGKMYYCEPVMVDYARQFFHEIAQLPDVKLVMHGEGLLQHMVYNKIGEPFEQKKNAVIAFSTPVTITSEHVERNRQLHLNPVYGLGGKKRKDVVLKLANTLKTNSVLDYGCGKGSLAMAMPFPIWEYDPAIAGKNAVPRPADLVICLNVLEHVEPEMLDNVLGDIVRCAKVMVFAIIDIASGEIQHDKDWWSKKLTDYFKIATILQSDTELHCVLEPRKLGIIKT